jgi:integrase
MARRKLSKAVVERIEPDVADVTVWDEALPGFGVRVKPSGVRSYLVQYRTRDGTSKRMTIGRHGPLLSFDQARKQARGVLADALRGADPAGERVAARKAPTVAQLAEDYLERHATPLKRAKSVRDDRSMLARIVLPKLGSKKVESVRRRDIEALHLTFRDRPYQANRVLSLLSKMFNLAVQWGWRPDNPVKGVPRFQELPRDRWLSDAELRRLTAALDAHPNQTTANAIRLQLLTGARLGEVLSARRDAFDLYRGYWRKPSHQTKQKRTEHLPLSQAAVELVREIIRLGNGGSDWLFPGQDRSRHITDIKRFWSDVTESAGINDYRRHDNRHTYASHLVSSGLSLEVVGRLLGHTSPTTTKRYAHLADDPLRQATERFAEKIARR